MLLQHRSSLHRASLHIKQINLRRASLRMRRISLCLASDDHHKSSFSSRFAVIQALHDKWLNSTQALHDEWLNSTSPRATTPHPSSYRPIRTLMEQLSKMSLTMDNHTTTMEDSMTIVENSMTMEDHTTTMEDNMTMDHTMMYRMTMDHTIR